MRAALTPLHQLPSCKLHMELWDTAGAERFRSMCHTPPLNAQTAKLSQIRAARSPIYFRNASGAVLPLVSRPIYHCSALIPPWPIDPSPQVIVFDVSSPPSLQVPQLPLFFKTVVSVCS